MDIISRIEIKHFRSFDGGKGQPKVIIENLTDINVFSGSNDSGKSNVLRALNLFFNDEISAGIKLNKERDFSKIAAKRFDEEITERKGVEADRVKKINDAGGNEKPKDLRRSDEVITIKLFFNNPNRQRGLPEYFWISKTFSQKNNFEGDYNYQEDLNKAQTTAFLNSFQFEYIPAIKDRQFFNLLFSKLQNYLFEKGDKSKKNQFKQSSESFNDILKSETSELFDNFFNSSGVSASFHIPSTLVDFFRTLSVQTENDVSLFDRGDGVQARFIPEILDEISRNSKKNIIWGFEEPENSYETKNVRKLKEDFIKKYSKRYQLFITTHTMELLALKREYTKAENIILKNTKFKNENKRLEALNALAIQHKSSNISIYRVWKENSSSHITRFDENNGAWEEICDDLGIINEARIIESLQEKIEEQIKTINASELDLSKQKKVVDELNIDYFECLSKLQSAESRILEFLKPILVVEDKYEAIYKIAYLKCENIAFTKENLDEIFNESAPFTIRRAGGAGSVRGFLSMLKTDGYEDKRVVGLFDYDKEGCENFYHLKDSSTGEWKNEILGDKKSGYYRKRKNHPCFYALLIPIPQRLNSVTSDVKTGVFTSFVEIENLISESKLIELGCVAERTVLDKKYYKVKDTIKSKALELFLKVDKKEFSDFNPLFKKVNELFNI
jgi:energy-coupling factor transporter ATP-binding protein EcfA2